MRFDVCASAPHPAAVDGDNRPVHVIRCRGGQEHDRPREIFRLAPAACGDAFQDRPGAIRVILQGLIEERYPVYAEADVAVDIDDSPPDVTTGRVRAALEAFLRAQEDAADAGLPDSRRSAGEPSP